MSKKGASANFMQQARRYMFNQYTNWKKGIPKRVSKTGSVWGIPAPSGRRRTVAKSNVKSALRQSGVPTRRRVGGQWSQHSKTFRVGRALSTQQAVNKLVRANKQKVIYRFQGIQPEIDGRGFYWLENRVLSATQQSYPLYAMDITGCINTTATAATRIALPLTSCAMETTTGNIVFLQRDGIRPDGTTASQELQIEQSPTLGVSGASPTQRDLLKWVQLRLNCYGCKNSATKYQVMLVRFTDRDLVPAVSISANQKRTNFFQALLKPNVYNPIAVLNNAYAKRMQVIKRQTFTIQDQANTSLDSDPNNKTLTWFVKLNKLCNYVERSTNIGNVQDFDAQQDFTQQLGNQCNEYLHETSRLYIIVMASNYGSLNEIPNKDVDPSFDMCVRMCHENFA